MEFKTPTRIQQLAIPAILKGRDVLMQAETGAGKTLAFVLPIVHFLSTKNIKREDGCKCIIILPTRELCNQVYNVLSRVLEAYHWIVATCITGGMKRKSEKKVLRKGVTMLCATPGRLRDHLLNTANFKIVKLKYLVLDEADRLFDEGFEKDLKEILHMLKRRSDSKRQNILVSATLEGSVKKLIGLALTEPLKVGMTEIQQMIKDEGGNENGETVQHSREFSMPSTLKHHVMYLKRPKRLATLVSVLRDICSTQKVLLFVATCAEVEYFYSLFKELKFSSNNEKIIPTDLYELRGDMGQQLRHQTFNKYCKAKKGLLICTDVAARGLDLPF
eukprot:UN25221